MNLQDLRVDYLKMSGLKKRLGREKKKSAWTLVMFLLQTDSTLGVSAKASARTSKAGVNRSSQ